jgi:hypothetical protein
MTKQECLDKTEDLIKDLIPKLRDKIDRFLKHGIIDLNHYQNDYELPRILIISAMLDEAENTNLLPRQKEEIKNLQRF